MTRAWFAYEVAPAIATLEAACANWQHPAARAAAARVVEHLAASGLIDASFPRADDVDDVRRIVERLRSARLSDQERTVLIVEDDRLTATIHSDALSAMNLPVIVAGSLREAQSIIATSDIGLAVLDLVLPDGDGRELIRALRAGQATRAMPLIVISSLADTLTHAECFTLGADVILRKPAAIELLITAVSTQLSHAAERRIEGRLDRLTGLANRAAFSDALERATQLSMRNQHPLLVAMIDLDHFKNVNDSYGHAVGDHVLQRCAQTISTALRKSDMVARWGGEEMAVLLPDTTLRGGVLALSKALNAVRNLEIVTAQGPIGITFSAGIAEIGPGGGMAELIQEADRLLYIAKKSGRDRIVSVLDEANPPRPRAMIVEDEPGVATLLKRLLERNGYDVVRFASGAGVVQAVSSEHFAFAIVDLQLPDASGFDLVLEMRKTRNGLKMPILMLTGATDEDNIIRGFEVGANEYVTKPFHPGELMARLHRILPTR